MAGTSVHQASTGTRRKLTRGTRQGSSIDETLSTATNPNTRTQTPSNYDKNHQGTGGQEQDNLDCDLETKDEEDIELPKVMKIVNSLKDFANVCEDKRDGVATTKQGRVDNHVGGGGEDGMVGRENPSNRNVFRNANKIIYPPGPNTSSFTKHERLLQDLVKTSPERSEPLQNKLDRDKEAGHGTTRMRGT